MKNLFTNYKEFYKNRHIILESYKKSSVEQKKELKRYIYSNELLKPLHRDLIWEYLNEPEDIEFYVSNNKLRKQYRKASKYENSIKKLHTTDNK